MATVQRKLVHKQFNSPMGLYSQENVKATLNRELKAFGADGIEIDEQITKPLNLANSAVLRAVEEEEQQVKCGAMNTGNFVPSIRQSRSRQRGASPPHHALHQQLLDQIKTHYRSHQHEVVIDRDTVLRINRMSTRRPQLRRDHSWPPVESEAESAAGRAAVTPSPTHSIDALRQKFNSPTRIVEMTARELRAHQLEGSTTTSTKVKQEKPPSQVDMPLEQQLPQQTPQARGFSAPETKAADADIGLVAPKCEYYEQLTHRRPTTPTATPKASTPYRPRLRRQSYSLDRGRARKRAVPLGASTELPPPKPRNPNGNGSGNGSGSGSGSGTPKLQRRSIKLATELKICYDTDTANDGDSEEEPKATTCPHSDDIDLEAMPLPATPHERAATAAVGQVSLPRNASNIIDGLALKQQQQLALALATAALGCTAPAPTESGRIVPVTVTVEATAADAQRIYDDACNYLRQDQAQAMDEPPLPTYVSATSGIKLQRQDSARVAQSSCIPTPPPLPPPPAAHPLLLRAKSRESQAEQQQVQSRRQGVIYADTPDELAKQHETHLEIAQLEAKYAHIQQSITEHLRQIDAYMENAKTALQRSVQATPEPLKPPTPTPTPTPTPAGVAPLSHASNNNELWDMFASRQSPILPEESPLQAILRQIYCRAAGIQFPPKQEQEQEQLEAASDMPAENVPIVERALEDLHRIAIALDSDEQKTALLHVEHKTTPMAARAHHVVIAEEEEEQEEKRDREQEEKPTTENESDQDYSLDYRHVSDVIANYEKLELSTVKERTAKSHQQQILGKDERSSKGRETFKAKLQQLQQELARKKRQQQELEELELEERLKEERKEQQRKQQEQLQLERIVQGRIEQEKKELQRREQEKLDQQLKEQEKKQQEQLEMQRKEQEMKTLEQKEKEYLEQEKQKQVDLQTSQEPQQKTEGDTTPTPTSPGCGHGTTTSDDMLGSWCTVCGECRASPHGWGKLNKADQWRFDNLQNEPLPNYKSTYEIRSPYVSRQISWEDAQQTTAANAEQQPKEPLQRQRSVIEIITSPAAPTPTRVSESKDTLLSRSSSQQPIRKYPAALIDTAQRCSSPFGLNAVPPQGPATPSPSPTPTPTPTTLEAKYSHVPQLEGHNIGLLVRTATQPLQLSMSASSSLLAATSPAATPRCNSQPPPFEFLVQHGAAAGNDFRPIGVASEELPREYSVNRSFDNVSPRPYNGIEGYKRVAWPPASEERIVREFTPQPQQTMSPAPGSGGYYPQATAPAPAPVAAPVAAAQGAIYNNVQPRPQQQQQHQQHYQSQQQPQHYYQQQYHQQQQHQPQSADNVYGPNTNYATNGYAAATVAAAASPTVAAAQYPDNNNYNYAEKPIQYTQAQFNRQPSREPASNWEQQHQHQQQQQQQYPHQQQQHQQPNYPQEQQQQQQHVGDNATAGWKHIGAPKPKTHREYTVAGAAPATSYPNNYQQQQHQQQQQQQPYYQQQQQQQYRAPSSDNYQQHQHQQQQQQPHWQQQSLPQQQPSYQAHYQSSPYQQQQNYAQQNGGANYAQPQYNSYSQPQQQLYSQDQTDQQQQSYRGASPGIITLRKEAPVSQVPAPVYTSQPAAVSYQGGSKLRGDLKWPPPEYKEAAARENEERRLLALGPVCRPRRVNRDYTPFFAKNQLNCTYPSYKVPPGTQHMFA